MNAVYLGLGSNLATPEQQLQCAITSLAALADSELVCCSSFYASRPMGPQDQPDYVNAVALINTTLTPRQLLAETQAIEQQQGRVRKANQWGPRTLDIDILLYGDVSLQSTQLTIPHYGMKQREFVLYPLFEIAPDLVLPSGEKLTELLAKCPLNGLEKREHNAVS
jgi:2-amino-4-hydroxy-6-hydroxymethyldihydropteridine diphosphokinase